MPAPSAAPGSAQRGGDPGRAFTEQWLELWQYANALGWGYLQGATLLCDPRRLRSRWLADLRDVTAEYLKSPAFLELMRCHAKAMSRSYKVVSPFRFE